MEKVLLYYGPKLSFMKLLPREVPIVTISELAVYSDKKMREYQFKIQGRRPDVPEKPQEKEEVPCLVAFSDQYAAISDSAVQGFLSFIDQFRVGLLLMQNPPAYLAEQFYKLNVPTEVRRYSYHAVTPQVLRQINDTYSDVIIGQEGVKHRLLTSLYPLCREGIQKPVSLLFYGPTGVGKTETAKFISAALGQRLLRRQLSMFQNAEFSTYLFGGRHSQSCLARDLLERESNVILFDEFDKPNPLFHSAFYQLFDEGIYEDKNYHVDVGRAVIICTSNYASEQDALAALGAPLYARFDAVIGFGVLSRQSICTIAAREYASQLESLQEDERGIVERESPIEEILVRSAALDNVRQIKRLVRDALSRILLCEVLGQNIR